MRTAMGMMMLKSAKSRRGVEQWSSHGPRSTLRIFEEFVVIDGIKGPDIATI
jgi:hypothetical protein